ncbi:MAG: ABC transporter permease [Bacteroidota bacterium]
MSINYVLSKVGQCIFTLLGASFFIFVLFYIAGSDPAVLKLGKYATLETIAATRREMGLDRPWFIQYFAFLKRMVTFDFGESWMIEKEVFPMIKARAMVSLSFTLPGFLLATLVNIPLSLFVSFYKRKWVDRLFMIATGLLMSISILSYILFFQYVLAYKLRLFPVAGYEYGFPYYIPYIMLPCLIIMILHMVYDTPLYRSMILEQIHQNYVRTARAKGLSDIAILFRHILKNVMIPMMTYILLELPALIIGSVVIESFFAIPGLGNFLIEAVQNGDFPIIQATAILVAILYAFCILVADLLYATIDKRIKAA